MALTAEEARMIAPLYISQARRMLKARPGITCVSTYASVLRLVRAGLKPTELAAMRFYDARGVCRTDILRDGGA